MEIIDVIIAILAGLATAIPLVIKLIYYVKVAVKARNWNVLLDLIMSLMKEAEIDPNLTDGEARKAYVMAAVRAAASTVNYDIDLVVISKLIDSLSELTKKVNICSTAGETK